MTDAIKESIEILNELLSFELLASETYQEAEKQLIDRGIAPDLEPVRLSHVKRAGKLQNEVMSLGGIPHQSSGLLGAFSKLKEIFAADMGDMQAIGALEECENAGLSKYSGSLGRLESPSRTFVERDLLPAQSESRRMISNLRQTLQ